VLAEITKVTQRIQGLGQVDPEIQLAFQPVAARRYVP
jgi:hypothetical protein